MTGLVIKSPWIELILSGQKTWEIRGSRTRIRERIALIKSKSARIFGRSEITDCIGPLTLEQLRASQEKHCIPLHMLDTLPYPKTYAWVVKNAKPLALSIPYRHPYGAVIWVSLNEQNVTDFARLSHEIGTSSVQLTAKTSAPTAKHASSKRADAESKPVPTAVSLTRAVLKSEAAPSGNCDLCHSFSIELADGSEVVPCRMHDRQTGVRTFKVSDGGNRSDAAILVTNETELRRCIEKGYRVRCKSRDGKRSGLFSGRSPNQIKSKYTNQGRTHA